MLLPTSTGFIPETGNEFDSALSHPARSTGSPFGTQGTECCTDLGFAISLLAWLIFVTLVLYARYIRK